MIPVGLLTAHPRNVREDRHADEALCASVSAVGVLVPLEITLDADGGYRVVDGNLRLDAAIKAGLNEVPYFFSPATAEDEGLQYLHMIITARYRRGLSVQEEAAALFAASDLGVSRAVIRKATGFKAADVKAGIAAGSLRPETRAMTARMEYQWDLEELAMLRQFEDDPETIAGITEAAERGLPVRYSVQRVLDERAAQARRAEVTAQLQGAGITVTDSLPLGGTLLTRLINGDQEMDADGHADCPGRGAYFPVWRDGEPIHYCADPIKYGHVFADTGTTSPLPPVTSAPPARPDRDREPGTDRRLIIEGNKAWVAAGKVRQQWLAEFLARKAPPRDAMAVIARFVTGQMLTMPFPLRQRLGGARQTALFETFGKPDADAAATSSQPGLWMLALVPIAVAYELEMTGDGDQRSTWRTDGRYSPCSRADAGAWLRFTAQIGYPLSPIEQAVADGVPYRGDDAGQPDLTTSSSEPEKAERDDPDMPGGTADREDQTVPVGIEPDLTGGADQDHATGSAAA